MLPTWVDKLFAHIKLFVQKQKGHHDMTNAFAHTINYDTTKSSCDNHALRQLNILQSKASSIFSFNQTIHYQQNQGREVSLSTDLDFYQNVENQQWCFSIKDVLSFHWSKGSKDIYYHLHAQGSPELLHYWLLHTLLPVYLTIENIYEFIHAGGIEIDGRPVLFIAPSYGGKSTLTDFFIQKGHTMISDDRVGLIEEDDRVMAVPSYPFHRPYRKMEDLGIDVKNFSPHPKPLDSVYLLQPAPETALISFEPLQGLEKYKALQYNVDFNLPLNKARSFALIAKIARSVDVYTLHLPWDLKRLDEVYEAIHEHQYNRSRINYDI